MTTARTIALFRNDIALTVADTRRKMMVVHNGNVQAVNEEIDFRLQSVWKISLKDWEAAQAV